jgi:phage gpG-like protein
MTTIAQFAKRLEDLARVPSRAAAEVSRELRVLIDHEFASGKGPYGESWRKLAPYTIEKGRTPPPLTDTGAMRASVRVAPMGRAGVSIVIGAAYAKFHQFGWHHHWVNARGPKRPMLPQGRKLPFSWQTVIERAVLKAYRSGSN